MGLFCINSVKQCYKDSDLWHYYKCGGMEKRREMLLKFVKFKAERKKKKPKVIDFQLFQSG